MDIPIHQNYHKFAATTGGNEAAIAHRHGNLTEHVYRRITISSWGPAQGRTRSGCTAHGAWRRPRLVAGPFWPWSWRRPTGRLLDADITTAPSKAEVYARVQIENSHCMLERIGMAKCANYSETLNGTVVITITNGVLRHGPSFLC